MRDLSVCFYQMAIPVADISIPFRNCDIGGKKSDRSTAEFRKKSRQGDSILFKKQLPMSSGKWELETGLRQAMDGNTACRSALGVMRCYEMYILL